MALVEKSALCPWEAAAKSAAKKEATADTNGATGGEKEKEEPAAPQVYEPSQKKRKFFGFREDPFVYLKVPVP